METQIQDSIPGSNNSPIEEYTFNPDIKKFFSDSLSDVDEDIEIILYRVAPGNRGRPKRFFLKRFYDVPREEEIGEEFGGGDYFLITTHPITGKVLSRNLFLDKSWNKPDPAIQTGSPSGDVATIKEIIGLVSPILKARPETDPLSLVEKMTTIMVGGMKKMNDALIDRQVHQINKPEVITETPSEYQGIVKDVIEIIKQWGGKFLEAKGLKETAYKTIINSDETMQEAKQNQLLASAIYSAGCMDPEIGPDKMKNLMQKLDFEIEPDNTVPNSDN